MGLQLSLSVNTLLDVIRGWLWFWLSFACCRFFLRFFDPLRFVFFSVRSWFFFVWFVRFTAFAALCSGVGVCLVGLSLRPSLFLSFPLSAGFVVSGFFRSFCCLVSWLAFRFLCSFAWFRLFARFLFTAVSFFSIFCVFFAWFAFVVSFRVSLFCFGIGFLFFAWLFFCRVRPSFFLYLFFAFNVGVWRRAQAWSASCGRRSSQVDRSRLVVSGFRRGPVLFGCCAWALIGARSATCFACSFLPFLFFSLVALREFLLLRFCFARRLFLFRVRLVFFAFFFCGAGLLFSGVFGVAPALPSVHFSSFLLFVGGFSLWCSPLGFLLFFLRFLALPALVFGGVFCLLLVDVLWIEGSYQFIMQIT